MQAESLVAAVSDKLVQVWPTFRQLAPELPEDITLITPPQRVELIVDTWSQLDAKTNTLQQELVAIKLKEKEQPEAMMQRITQAIAEGNTVRSSLHARDEECRWLFDMITDWVGLLNQRSNPFEELRTRLNKMHAESRAIVDHVEQAAKFTEIQAKDDKLDAMDEANKAAKTELRHFRPTVQVEYIMMQ